MQYSSFKYLIEQEVKELFKHHLCTTKLGKQPKIQQRSTNDGILYIILIFHITQK